jgi:DNA (cytosine-5)-methyltransferase 1
VLNGLDLFSGIGGLSVALAPWVRPVAYCENDRYAQGVLVSRMHTGQLHRAPIWDDVRTLRGDMLPGVDIIYGGFPCQDVSAAGRRVGLGGERSGLVREVFRLCEEIRPAFVFLENVPAIRTRGAEQVGKALAGLGYDSRWDTLSAAAVGAPHERLRWWLLAADTNRTRIWNGWQRSAEGHPTPSALARDHGEAQPVAADAESERPDTRGEIGQQTRQPEPTGSGLCDTDRARLEIGQHGPSDQLTSPFGASWWGAEPDVGRMAHGVPKRVDRLRALGNAVVPAQAREAFQRLSGLTLPFTG